jgi:hypothetical protein
MNPTNPEAARLVATLAEMDVQRRLVWGQLDVVQAACRHRFPAKYDRFGDWCLDCGKFFTAIQQIEEEQRANAKPAAAVDDLEDFDQDFDEDEDEDFIDEDDVYGEDGLD